MHTSTPAAEALEGVAVLSCQLLPVNVYVRYRVPVIILESELTIILNVECLQMLIVIVLISGVLILIYSSIGLDTATPRIVSAESAEPAAH